jgi:hypothetical protein
MTLPCRWSEGGLTDFAGRARYRRSFGIPRQLDDYERVWITFNAAKTTAEVWLNGQLLGRNKAADDPFEFEVTSLLQERNELIVEVESDDVNGGLYGEVALEVRTLAYPRSVRAWIESGSEGACLHVSGEVVGSSEHPLDLYAILGRSTAAYSKLEPFAVGAQFHLISETLGAQTLVGIGSTTDMPHVRVELICRGTIWYSVEVPVSDA